MDLHVNKTIKHFLFFPIVLVLTASLTACGGSDDDTEGFVRLYNASPNAPELFMFIEEDLSDDPDDEIFLNFSGIDYEEATARTTIVARRYEYEIALQNDDSTRRDDLEVILTGEFEVLTEETSLFVLTGDINSPQLVQYQIPLIDEEDDDDNDLFNLQLLNLSTEFASIDVWLSEDDQTFNEATNIGSAQTGLLSDNLKLDQEEYIVYLTESGSNTVLFESSEISYNAPSQYIISIMDNPTIAATQLTMDSISNGQVANFDPQDSQSRVRFYNGIAIDDLEPNYSGIVDIESNIAQLEDDAEVDISGLTIGSTSSTFDVNRGDYSLSIIDNQSDVVLIQNQRLSLAENSDKTIFLFNREEFVDDDGDGNFDENGDGIIDEIRVIYNIIDVDNSQRDRFFDNLVTVVNLIDNEDFNNISVYFVKSDEVIDTAQNRVTGRLGNPTDIVLLNNSYEVFALANVDGVEQILGQTNLVLDEDTNDQFLVIEQRPGPLGDYTMTFIDQREED